MAPDNRADFTIGQYARHVRKDAEMVASCSSLLSVFGEMLTAVFWDFARERLMEVLGRSWRSTSVVRSGTSLASEDPTLGVNRGRQAWDTQFRGLFGRGLGSGTVL